MTQRLSIKDTIQEWVTKINDAINLGTVDGYFTVLSENGLDITLASGNVRKSSTQFTVAQSTLTLPVSQASVIGINTASESFLVTAQSSEPTSAFIPLYLVSTSASSITSLEDLRTWAFDDSGSIEAVVNSLVATISQAQSGSGTELMNVDDVAAYLHQFGLGILSGNTIQTCSNIDSLTLNVGSQYYFTTGTTGSTPSSYGIVFILGNPTQSSTSQWIYQVAFDTNGIMWWRSSINQAAYPNTWNKLWDSNNFDPNLKANLASPALTGTPTAPTPATSDNSTKIATTAFSHLLASGYLPLHGKADTAGTADNSLSLGGTLAASYALQSWVNSNFLTQTNASNTYLTKSSAYYNYHQPFTPTNIGYALGTVHTNSTGRPITVFVTAHGNAGQAPNRLTGYINGVNFYSSGSFGQPSPVGITFTVPAGSTYEVAGSNVVIESWYEQ